MSSCSSLSMDRVSEPFFTYGPYRPLLATTSSPSTSPRMRGNVNNRRASSMVTVSSDIDWNRLAVRGLSLRVLGQDLGDVGAVATVLRDELATRDRVDAQRPVTARLVEQRLCVLLGHLVGRYPVGQVRTLAIALEVGAVAADAHDDARVAERERADVSRVDLAEPVVHHCLEAGVVVTRTALAAAPPPTPSSGPPK